MFNNKYIIKDDITEIYLKKRNKETEICIIDTEDLQRLIDFNVTWYIKFNKNNKTNYVIANIYNGKINGKLQNSTITLQTFILNTRTGDSKNRIIVDHKDHNPMNNKKENLRIIINQNNSRHRKGKNINNTSGYRNVSWDKKNNNWMVQLQVEGKNKILGRFDNVDEAGKFAEIKRKELYGKFAGEN